MIVGLVDVLPLLSVEVETPTPAPPDAVVVQPEEGALFDGVTEKARTPTAVGRPTRYMDVAIILEGQSYLPAWTSTEVEAYGDVDVLGSLRPGQAAVHVVIDMLGAAVAEDFWPLGFGSDRVDHSAQSGYCWNTHKDSFHLRSRSDPLS